MTWAEAVRRNELQKVLVPEISRLRRTIEGALAEVRAAEEFPESFNDDLARCEEALRQADRDLRNIREEAIEELRQMKRAREAGSDGQSRA